MTENGERFILLVEENPDHAELIQLALKDSIAGMNVRHLSSGEEAVAFFDRGERPSLVLMDLRMPGMDGLEVLTNVRSRHELDTVPILVLSTSNARTDIAAAYERRANGYLVKPMKFQEFRDMLGATVTFWLKWNRSV